MLYFNNSVDCKCHLRTNLFEMLRYPERHCPQAQRSLPLDLVISLQMLHDLVLPLYSVRCFVSIHAVALSKLNPKDLQETLLFPIGSQQCVRIPHLVRHPIASI